MAAPIVACRGCARTPGDTHSATCPEARRTEEAVKLARRWVAHRIAQARSADEATRRLLFGADVYDGARPGRNLAADLAILERRYSRAVARRILTPQDAIGGLAALHLVRFRVQPVNCREWAPAVDPTVTIRRADGTEVRLGPPAKGRKREWTAAVKSALTAP